MTKHLFGGAGGASAGADLGFLAMRLVAGLGIAFGHGILKLPPSEGFVKGVVGMGMPAFMAWGATFAELGGGILLVLGLFTRPAAALILFTMCVALFGVHAAQPFARQELALLYGVIALFFVLSGAGRFSIDSMIRK
ncbi:MAG: DoxX family protein [Bryobacterales bacterium]|nr:DoxX family protein [Bryobacterales bacterium]